MQWLVKQARKYKLNPSLQFCSNHANPPHSLLHTMVVTASAQMRVDVCRWKTWGDTRKMANEWGGIDVNRQMKTSISRNTDGKHGEGMEIELHIYKTTRGCTQTDCFYITKSCTHSNITDITSAQLHTALRHSELRRSDCSRLAQRSGEGTNMHFNLFMTRRADAIKRLEHKNK